MLRSLDRWLLPWLLRKRRPRVTPLRHVVLAVCDHFEPLHDTDLKGALRRLTGWRSKLPGICARFADAGGRAPRPTLFYPIEQYRQDLLGEIALLGMETGAEVEVHLHHDADTGDGLRAALRRGIAELRSHGFLGSDPEGRARFGFIHGNWALDHSHPARRHCGVPDELGILRAEGCYADFTMPSAPSPTQARMVNALYYAPDTPAPRSHDRGVAVGCGLTSALRGEEGHLLCVQGPLALNFRRRKFGLLPRIENADLTGANPPTPLRLGLWIGQGVHVVGAADTVFVKLHTHGALPANQAMFLDGPWERFLEALGPAAARGGWQIWFATAREMVNILHAREDGRTEEPGFLRDYLYAPPPLFGGGAGGGAP